MLWVLFQWDLILFCLVHTKPITSRETIIVSIKSNTFPIITNRISLALMFQPCTFWPSSGLHHWSEGWRSQMDCQTPLQRLSRSARESESCFTTRSQRTGPDLWYRLCVHSPLWVTDKILDFCRPQLTAEKKIDKHLLPPKKIIGKNSKSLVEKRQKELEVYLQTLLNRFPSATPKVLSSFLHYHLYVSVDVITWLYITWVHVKT